MHKKKYSGILIPTHCVIDKDFNLNPRENAAIKHVLGMFEAQVIYIVFPTQETLEHKPDSHPLCLATRFLPSHRNLRSYGNGCAGDML